MLLSSLGTSIANVGLPTLAQVFNASFAEVQWVVLAYLLAITSLIVSVGRLGDLIGRRRLLLIGIAIFTVASILCGAAPTLWWLLAARAVQGLGAAIMMALTMAFVGEMVPKEKTGSAMGLLGTMSAIGTALGPTLGGVLISGFGWSALFFINVPLGLLALLLGYRFLPRARADLKWAQRRFDIRGTLLLVLTLVTYALAVTVQFDAAHSGFGWLNLLLLMMALLAALLFIAAAKRTASPLIPLRMFRSPLLSAGFAMSTLVTTVVMATLVVGPFYLSGALMLDAAEIGLVMSSGPLVAALTGVPAGRLVDRFGAQRMTLSGLIAMATGAALLPLLSTHFGIPAYVAPLMLLTAGYAVFQAANNTAVMTGSPPDQRGVIAGMLNLSRNLGLVTGASVMGAVFAFGAAASNLLTATPAAVTAGMRLTFIVATVIILIALVIAVASHARAARAVAAKR
ncbi:MFS transporter [Permianibacter sp. IMCC34836]|nr:MFS transporter [Permianibacter fluminis]